MKTKTHKKASFVFIGLFSALTIGVNAACGYFSDIITSFLNTTELDIATRAAGEQLAEQIEEEGIVMVENKNETLPLSQTVSKVNVFGWSSTQWIMGGSGSGRSVNESNLLTPDVDLFDALENYGIEYNTDLKQMYTKFLGERPFWNTGALNSHDYEFSRLYEPSISDTKYYTSTMLADAKEFSDTALVVLGRVTGESNDCPKVQYKNITTTGLPGAANTDATRTYLDISTEEEELLEYVGANYENVIVIVNSTNQMNLSFLDSINGLDSCLIVGGTGNKAANAIPYVLYGEKTVTDEDGNETTVKVSPSGKTVDTYAYDFTSNAVYANAGMDGINTYVGSNGLYPTTTTNPNVGGRDNKYPGASYLDYVEGIYVGYKWYETADVEGYWDKRGGYDSVVQYPFGYGMSYTTFEWSFISALPAAGSTLSETDSDGGSINVTVNVKNTGNYPGQDVVELYFTAPYTKNGIEKSAVNLAAFAKTPTTLQPGESQQLTLSVKIADMASYDSSEIKVPGGGYILEKGTYQLTLRTDSHTLADMTRNTLEYTVASDIIFDGESAKGNDVHNLFGAESSDGFAVDASDTNANIEWLSRADFEGTFPTEKAAAREMTQALKDANNKGTYSEAMASAWQSKWNAANPNATMPTTGAKNDLKVFADGEVTDLGLDLGKDYYDEQWDDVLDQITLTEMKNLILHGYIKESAVPSIGKPLTSSLDGPSQIGSFNANNAGTGYPMPTVLAQTWNTQLARSFGLAVGAETLNMNLSGWYAPGINLHRSAFGGRNYEYYSEDSYLSGILCAETVRGAKDVGVYTYIKHFIGYDQESYRDGLYCWMTEQALRETYLSPYKTAIDNGATGIMTSYGRLGAIWSGGSQALLTDLLRNEWGFTGTVLTDYSDHQDFMNGDQMLRAGGDLWMDGYQSNGSFKRETSSVAIVTQMREATHHILYTWLNAQYSATQYDPTADGINIVKGTGNNPYMWMYALTAADALIVPALLSWFVLTLKKKSV